MHTLLPINGIARIKSVQTFACSFVEDLTFRADADSLAIVDFTDSTAIARKPGAGNNIIETWIARAVIICCTGSRVLAGGFTKAGTLRTAIIKITQIFAIT
jgi:hypothetical protein